ncbi:MAG: DUF932 domain-containing protein [Candidatus Methylomirabilia bacterium]
MSANVESMAYYGKVPWHGLGTEVPKGVSSCEMIHAAGLDWSVELKPARGSKEINKKKEFSRYEIVRIPRQGSDENEILFGVVSRKYHPLQNSEAFKFFDPIVGEGMANYETAGALGEGERVWVIARMPDVMKIAPSDECRKYLMLSNTHTGEGAVAVKFTAVRVVCQNTLMLAMSDGQKTYKVRHSRKMQERLRELTDLLAMTHEIFLEAEEIFQKMARLQVKQDRLYRFLDEVFPRTKEQRDEKKIPKRWAEVEDLYASWPDLQIEGVRGTLWGAYNAVTMFIDHGKAIEDELPDTRLERIWYGSGADTKLRALEVAKRFVR